MFGRNLMKDENIWAYISSGCNGRVIFLDATGLQPTAMQNLTPPSHIVSYPCVLDMCSQRYTPAVNSKAAGVLHRRFKRW